jgi:hypothetical protein
MRSSCAEPAETRVEDPTAPKAPEQGLDRWKAQRRSWGLAGAGPDVRETRAEISRANARAR